MLKAAVSKVFFDALLKSEAVGEAVLHEQLDEAQRLNKKLGRHLLQSGVLTAEQILQIQNEHLHLENISLKTLQIDPAVIQRVPIKFASYYHFMPISIDRNKLTIAVFEPLDIHSQDDIRASLGLTLKYVLAPPWDIEEALKKYYGFASDTIDKILTREPKKRSYSKHKAIEDIEAQTDDPSVTRLVNQIILEAYQKRATDIHIEPYRNRVRFRYRIDGVLIDANLPSEARHFQAAILSRLKIMANLSITEKRLPQDGSAVVRATDQTLDLRVSTIPTPHGESMVIRILPTETTLLNLEKLGFNADNARRFRDLINRPHGVIFVTGPTGSGKTTTLYACLNEISDPRCKIITIEDPVEYEMEGITQIQVNPSIDFDFAKGLRSVLRHDPDILMVGEVRDLETAEIAIRTALTGHLVFSTLHTNDAASAVTRLVDMGVEPYLVASSVQAFVAQRLVRVLCSHCKEVDDEPMPDVRQEIAQSLSFSTSDEIQIYRGKGCDRCNGTGYFGRTAIYEILEVNEHVRAAILDGYRTESVKKVALKYGMRTLRQDGWVNVLNGITTPAEVMNVTMREGALLIESASESLDQEATVHFHNALLEESSTKENRGYPRLPEDLCLEYCLMERHEDGGKEFHKVGDPISVITRDVSASGLSFFVSQPLEAGSLLMVRFHLAQFDEPFHCLTRVIRVEEHGEGRYLIGVFYLDMDPAARQRLMQFLNSLK